MKIKRINRRCKNSRDAYSIYWATYLFSALVYQLTIFLTFEAIHHKSIVPFIYTSKKFKLTSLQILCTYGMCSKQIRQGSPNSFLIEQKMPIVLCVAAYGKQTVSSYLWLGNEPTHGLDNSCSHLCGVSSWQHKFKIFCCADEYKVLDNRINYGTTYVSHCEIEILFGWIEACYCKVYCYLGTGHSSAASTIKESLSKNRDCCLPLAVTFISWHYRWKQSINVDV